MEEVAAAPTTLSEEAPQSIKSTLTHKTETICEEEADELARKSKCCVYTSIPL
jgi:hypothetical protein